MVPHRARLGALIGLGLMLAACAQILGLEEFSGRSANAGHDAGTFAAGVGAASAARDGGGTDDRDGGEPCGPAGVRACIEDAPADWKGPIALATGPAATDAPSCAATGYERRVLSLLGGLDQGSAHCGCSCSAPSEMRCVQTVSLLYQSSTAPLACLVPVLGPELLHTLAPSECGSAVETGTYRAPTPAFAAVACTPEPSAEIVEAVWTRRAVACATNDGVAQDCAAAQRCLPALRDPLEVWCIHRDGEHDCPAGVYAERRVYYADLEDDRSCAVCGCGDPTGSCQGSITFTRGEALNGCGRSVLEGWLALGGCLTLDSARVDRVAMLDSISPEGQCEPMGGELRGAVTPIGPVTFCCRP